MAVRTPSPALGILHRAVDRIGSLPVIWHLRREHYDEVFCHARDANLFRGVYATFEEAEAAAPQGLPVSYDNTEAAQLYLRRLQANDYDRAAFFWLERSFEEGMRRVFDVGGNAGIKYYAYSRLVPLPEGAHWLVEDLPAEIEEGRRLAAERNAGPELEFTDRFADGSGYDVLYASGALQYLPRTLASLLGDLDERPKRIVLNVTAIHPERAYFTLQNIGAAFCAYRVQARDTFVREMEEAGYALRDEWHNPALPLRLPFNTGYDLHAYAGFCFDRVG